MMNKLTVIDLFCGAGGFSEGFRQGGYKIVMGVDRWDPAVKTFNHNFGLSCSVKNILDFQNNIDQIESLPDTDIIVGSPPCVTFSSSNFSGKADKTSGINLTLIFLKIVAIKKWKPRAVLKAWFMENVPSSIKHLGDEYTFEQLGLMEWATKNKIKPSTVAINLKGNQCIINSADYGSAQCRERVIAGEIINQKKLIIPKPTHIEAGSKGETLKHWRILKEIKNVLPSPYSNRGTKKVIDPNYPQIKVSSNQISDHFYDTGLFQSIWKQSRFLKVNHPYMGRMSFPEREDRPSRTITATNIGTSREAIIYKAEINREENGKFRTPTVREAACIMGFPITFQFLGGESTKWRLVGNAVCPSVAKAFANLVRAELGLESIKNPVLQLIPNLENVNNLNCYSKRVFDNPPKRNKGSRFRRHPFKEGNITVTLSNYSIDKNSKNTYRWRTSIQYGNGNGFPTFHLSDGYYKSIEKVIKKTAQGLPFLEIINNGFSEKIAKGAILQKMYEAQKSINNYLEPTLLIEKIADIINGFEIENEKFEQNKWIIFKDKERVPLKQLFALYAINKVATIANRK